MYVTPTPLPWDRRCHLGLCVLFIVGIALFSLALLPFVHLPLPDSFFNDWLITVMTLLAAADAVLRLVGLPREQRRVWLPLAIGLTSYALGAALWSFWFQPMASPPFPSLADPLWLAFYPLGYLTIGLSIRQRVGRLSVSIWLDGLIAGLAMAAVVGALMLGPVLDGAQGSIAAVVTNVAYPIGDLLLVGGVVAACALTGWTLPRSWALLVLGFVSFTAADGLYLTSVIADDIVTKTLPNLLWSLGVVLLAQASWAPPRPIAPQRRTGRLAALIPSAFALMAVALLIIDHDNRLDTVSLILASATIAVALLRLGITGREERQLRESRQLASTDELTGLPNRRALKSAVAGALKTDPPEPCALLLLDLNGFKELNDTLGHEAGDELLRALGFRLRGALREEDLLARLGGDEFAVLVRGCRSTTEAETVARKLLAATHQPIELLGIRVQTGASVGIACYPEHGSTVSDLLKRSDVAMYRAKTARTEIECYDKSRDGRSSDRLALVGELGSALQHGQITAHYQPQVDPASGRLIGVEALTRWEHPERGLLLPGQFLSAIEHTNHSRALTLRMIELAASDWARWQHEGLDVPIAVNLFAANLMDDALPGDIADVLRLHTMPADRLRLEVTETTVLTDPRRSLALLHQLRHQGIQISLDDFGTKHSSLAHLQTLPVDELKIDRSFVRQVTTDPRTAIIVTATVALARSLGLRCIAEGVEDDRTLAALLDTGCDAVQGFFYAQAMPGDQLAAWSREHTTGPVRAA